MHHLRRIAVALALGLVSINGWSQEAAVEQNPALGRLREYRFKEIEDDKNVPLQFVDKSLLNWTNPVFGTTEGGLFLWTRNDRPSAIMKTYTAKAGGLFEQVRSFSRHPMIARESEDGRVFWSPPGTPETKLLVDAPQPAETTVARLSQMKLLHNSFNVTGMLVPAGQLTLRPLPTPIYRYQSDRIIDGAVFAFVQGTGPDMILILEAREADGKRQWFYELGSIGIFAVEVVRNGQTIWTETRRDAPNTKPTDIYDARRLNVPQ